MNGENRHDIRPIKAATHAAVLSFLLWMPLTASAQTLPCKSTSAGTIELVGLTSRVFHNERYLRVWLPPGYSDNVNEARQYPAIYLMDGQTVFDGCAETRDGSSWKVNQTLSELIEQGRVPPIVVIGVDHMGVSRPYEYLPYKDIVADPDSIDPAGKQFPEFLARDVLPVINKRYRIAKGAQNIGGSSYGAVAALYALLTRPDLFNAGLIASPSLGIGNGQLLRDTEHLFSGPSKVFLGAGALEFGDDPDSPDNLGYIRMIRILENNLKGAAQGQTQTLTVIQPGGKHSLSSWAAQFGQAIQFLYNPVRP
jgi:predicted alpha/beta superfamily hydrolase